MVASGVIENLYCEKTKPEALKSTIGKLVCEGYRGPCEDITELDEEERHSSMHSSGVNASRGHRHCNSSANAKENNINVINVKAFVKEKSSRYASSDSEPYTHCEPRNSIHDILNAKEERLAQSTELIAKENRDAGDGETCGRSYSNPMNKSKRTKVIESTTHDEYDIGKSALRWVDPTPPVINSTQRSSINLKNDEFSHLQKKLRSFELNKIFKRVSTKTCNSFTRNNNKSSAKLEAKCGSATSDNKQQGKVLNSRYKSVFTNNSNNKAIALRSFDYPTDNNCAYRSVTLRRGNNSRSRDSDRRAR